MKHCQSILLFLASCFLAACSRHTQVTVSNNSGATLTDVVASGSGFSQPLGPLAPGAQQRIAIKPHGESGLKLEFDADGKHFATQKQGYFENGYTVSVIVSSDFSITVSSALRY